MQEKGRVSSWTSRGPAVAKSLLLRPATPIHETHHSSPLRGTFPDSGCSQAGPCPGDSGLVSPTPLCFLLTLQSNPDVELMSFYPGGSDGTSD